MTVKESNLSATQVACMHNHISCHGQRKAQSEVTTKEPKLANVAGASKKGKEIFRKRSSPRYAQGGLKSYSSNKEDNLRGISLEKAKSSRKRLNNNGSPTHPEPHDAPKNPKNCTPHIVRKTTTSVLEAAGYAYLINKNNS